MAFPLRASAILALLLFTGCDRDASRCEPAAETCNGEDDDCDAVIDEDALDATRWYADTNGDGLGDPATTRTACRQPAGFVSVPGAECDASTPCPGPTCSPETCFEGVCLALEPAGSGTPCDDGDACTPADACDGAGTCVAGPALVCDDPPDVDVAAACKAASTVDVYLGDGCGGTCDPATGTCAYAATSHACPDGSEGLPQDHGWEVALRAGLAAFEESDFDVELAPFTLDDASMTDPEDWFLLSLALDRYGFTLPTTLYLRSPSSRFTLAAIEQDDGVHGGGVSLVDSLLFWERWDYPGNPHAGDPAIARRAFAYAAVDLMMLDRQHALGAYAAQHYLSGSMSGMAGALLDAGDLVPACTAAAYRKGLQGMFERLEDWDTNNGNNDMAQPGHVAMYEAALAMPDPSWLDRARAESEEIFDESGYWHDDAGYFDHGVALDSTYEGISIHFLVAAALGTPWPHIDEHLGQYLRLKGWLTLPEPDGVSFVSPSHWNPATGGGVTEDQWWSRARDVACAMASDEALHLAAGGRADNVPYDITDETAVRDLVVAAAALLNSETYAYGQFGLATDAWTPGPWAETHWSWGRIAPVLSYQRGFYERYATLETEGSPLLLPPLLRGEAVESFGDDFVAARFADYAAIVYAGPIADSWATGMAGMGGGALSAFWTPAGGAFLLGFTHGSQNPRSDTWDEVEIWPVQHLYGTTPSGGAFSTALVQEPGRTVTTSATDATVAIAGTIDEEAWSGAGVLSSPPTYARDIVLDDAGVTVSTTLRSKGADTICSLVDVVPLYLGSLYATDPEAIAEIRFVTEEGEVIDASAEWTGAARVEVHRFDGDAVVTLDEPRRVRMAPDEWTDTYQHYPRSWSLQIDVLGTDACGPLPGEASISWSIGPG